MPTKKTSGSTGKKTSAAKRPAAKKSATRKSAARPRAALAAGDRLTDVARSIGLTVGELVVRTKRALHRGGESQ